MLCLHPISTLFPYPTLFRSHWSAGVQASVNHSTFGNVDIGFAVGPAIEYDIYPYSQSTRRQLTFLYSVRSEEHTSELQSHVKLVCSLQLVKKKTLNILFLLI